MILDERFAAYVRGQWADLIGDVATLCPDADEAEAQDLVLSALSRVALRRRSGGDLDAAVRRRLLRACVGRGLNRRRDVGEDFQLMDVGFAGRPADPTSPTESPAPVSPLTPPTLTPDEALVVVASRVGRGRRRMVVAGAAGLVVVVALTSSVIRSLGGSQPPPQRVIDSIGATVFPRVEFDFAGGVAAGGGHIWSIENHPTKQGSQSYVVERDPDSGDVEHRYRVPAADDQIGYGLGKVWTWRNGDDTADTAIATIDGAGAVDIQRTSPSISIESVAFTSTRAWVTEPQADAVVSYPGGVFGDSSTARVRGPQFAVPVSPSSVLVAGSFGALHELPGGRVVDPAARFLTLLAAAPPYGFWIGHDNRLTYQSGIGATPSVSLTLPHVVGAVSGDPTHGVFVALRSNSPLHHDPYLVYYSPAALAERQPRPTARLDGGSQAESMAADPAGGVVFATNEGTIGRWDPAGVPSTRLQRGSS